MSRRLDVAGAADYLGVGERMVRRLVASSPDAASHSSASVDTFASTNATSRRTSRRTESKPQRSDAFERSAAGR